MKAGRLTHGIGGTGPSKWRIDGLNSRANYQQVLEATRKKVSSMGFRAPKASRHFFLTRLGLSGMTPMWITKDT